MHLLDLTHTAHTRVQTGIQVVCRALYAELAKRQAAQPVTWDRYARAWRALEAWEQQNLDLRREREGADQPKKRRAKWPLRVRLRGRWQRHFIRSDEGRLPATTGGLIVPELFDPSFAPLLARLRVPGPRVAIFYDAIPLKFPELSPAKTVGFFPGYMQSLLQFDGIAAISEDSAQTLRDYFCWLGAKHVPEITAIPLGVTLPDAIPPALALDAGSGAETPALAEAPPTILAVGSIEGRKNHLALLNAAETLWARGRQFKLHIIGLAQSETGRAPLEKIATLQAAGRPLHYAGHASHAAVEAAYAACAFTVYPSIIEGFGLPVIESLARGRPCICSGRGALGEVAQGGGTLTLDEVTASAIAAAIDTLLQSPPTLAALATAARARRFRTWGEYTDALLAWMAAL